MNIQLKHLIITIVCTIFALPGFGQNLSVESVEALQMDLSAAMSSRMDLAGKPCGLVKVVLPLQNVAFEGNVVGDVEFKSGEYWVYLSANSKHLKVKHAQSKPVFIDFGNYDIQSIASNSTYQVVINTSYEAPDVDVTFKVYPNNAILTIDQREYPVVDGVAVVPLSPKEHNYTVVAYGYKTYGNKFQVYPDQINKIVVELEPSENGGIATNPAAVADNTQQGGEPEAGSDYLETTEDLSMKMIWVEGGSFVMGGTPEQGSDTYEDERVVRRVKLNSYYIGESEITQEQWRKIMGSTIEQQARKANTSEYCGVGSNHPMYYVSWDEAQAFCRELSRLSGRKYRLPTEAEWEYAARGGKNEDGTKFSGGDAVDAVAWHKDNSGASTHPVMEKRENGLKLYDMSGNVWEWCSDWFNGPYEINDTDNPTGALTGTNRILRGGGWNGNARGCRVSNRGDDSPTRQRGNYGFRVVLIP